MMNELAEIGFRVIDSRWTSDWRDGEGQFGHRREAAWYATLVKYLHRIFIDCADVDPWPGPFIAVGHSSGAAEVGYALTAYGLEPYIDLAILSSGPPEARLDLACGNLDAENFPHGQCDEEDEDDPPLDYTWCDALFCDTDYKTTSWGGGLVCTPGYDLCGDGSDPGDMIKRPPCIFDSDDEDHFDPSCLGASCLAFLNENSVLFGDGSNPDPDASKDYARTTVHTILGLGDDSQGTAGGLAFYDHLESRKRLWYFAGGHNWFRNSLEGRKLLKYAIEYFTRPFIGDVDFDGDVDESDYDAVCDHTEDCEAEDDTVGCSAPPNPGSPAPNYDVNNDGVVNIDDLDIIGATIYGNCSPTPCSVPLNLSTCESQTRAKELYPAPTAASDCSAGAPDACNSYQCQWCGEE